MSCDADRNQINATVYAAWCPNIKQTPIKKLLGRKFNVYKMSLGETLAGTKLPIGKFYTVNSRREEKITRPLV